MGEDNFFVVGIGASAGGLRALEEFFENMPADSGAAFIVIQHLSPDFKSLMKEQLERRTPMEVHRVEEGMAIALPKLISKLHSKKTTGYLL
ncbi:MAG: chemotaxis protein CheB [Xenococcaceae cyanobacterium MO_234.B1]|nr:chemotaxis protein CheB [Xenococcaceae cyanobacterium MO_234.B1]